MSRRLGKGLDSLLAYSEAETSERAAQEGSVMMLPLDSVFPNPDQPRKDFEPDALEELSASIKEKGVLQPILVQMKEDGRYYIIAGERRYRASKLAGKTEIPALVKDYSQEETLEIALIENLQRSDLNAVEEALAYQSLISRFSLSQEEIARRIGKKRSTVTNSLRLLRLPEDIRSAIRNNEISSGHARALLSLDKDETALQDAFSLLKEKGLSVRDTEALVRFHGEGLSVGEAYKKISSSRGAVAEEADADDEKTETISILNKAGGATLVTGTKAKAAPEEKRPAELWDMEEKLIRTLGTKVQIKGDLKDGKIEISYYSMDDLERLYEIFTRGAH